MKTLFVINKTSILFYFILDICQGVENDFKDARSSYWLKKTGGKLNDNELKTVKGLLRVIKKHGNENLDILFLENNDKLIWKKLSSCVNKTEMKIIKTALSEFSPRFNLIWPWGKMRLGKRAEYYQKNEKTLLEIIHIICRLCQIKKFNISSVPIHLLLSSPASEDSQGWFSWTPKQSKIVLECSGWRNDIRKKFPIAILAHEIFHLIIRKNKKLNEKIQSFSQNNKETLNKICDPMPVGMFFEEMLLSSFIPEGYLSKKYLNIPTKRRAKYELAEKSFFDIILTRRYIAQAMKAKAKNYTDGKSKFIDSDYFNEMLLKLLKAK